MTGALPGIGAMALGATTAALPALTWFSARAPGGRATVSGFGAAGELWLMPALGALAVAGGAALVAAGPRHRRGAARWAGQLVLVAGVLAVLWSLRAGLDPPVELTVRDRGVPTAVATPVRVEAAAVAAPIVAGALAALGAAIAWSGLRR